MKIKIYPSIGDAYIVIVPESVVNADTVDAWIERNFNFVEEWEEVDWDEE